MESIRLSKLIDNSCVDIVGMTSCGWVPGSLVHREMCVVCPYGKNVSAHRMAGLTLKEQNVQESFNS